MFWKTLFWSQPDVNDQAAEQISNCLSTLDPLVATVQALQLYLREGKATSTSLVEMYLNMINKHDHYLHAMISLAPSHILRDVANRLDIERKEGNVRSPLHGIPITITDNIATHPDLGMGTTCGALALKDMRPFANARIVDLLLEAGIIILGKANLSELAYFRSYTMPSGWSAIGGQCQSAYVRGGVVPGDSKDGHSNPSGSSAGPAVGVSAGYAPFSIGTETDASLVCPAGRAALYSIKPTMGTVSQKGIIPISHTMDSACPMAKTPYDLALLLDVIQEPGSNNGPPFVTSINGSWSGLSIAAVNYETWWYGEDFVKPVESVTKQVHTEIQAAYDKIGSLTKGFVTDVPLISPTEYELHGKDSEFMVMLSDFKDDFEAHLKSLEYCQVRTIDELIDFNLHHRDLELTPLSEAYSDQQVLEDAIRLDLSRGQYDNHLKHMRRVARKQGLDKIFNDYEVDIIIGPCDSSLPSLASGSGYPIVSVPLGYANFNGRPFGLVALAGAQQEPKLFQFMSAWEATFGPRKAPPMLQT